MVKKNRGRGVGRRRRLQPSVAAMMGSTLGAAAAAGAAHVATTFTGRGRGRPKNSKGKKGNLRGASKQLAIRQANSEGYIPGYSKVIGNSRLGKSFTEKVQQIMNPPQTFLFHNTQKIEATSGRQGAVGWTLNNFYLDTCFSSAVGTRTDNNTTQATQMYGDHPTNKVNHLFTSVQHTFMNSGNLTAELEVYIFRAAQDIDSIDASPTAIASWTYAESINPVVGYNDTNGVNTIGKKPTDASTRYYMSRYWRLIGSCAVKMKPGESFKHYWRQHYNKPLAKFMLHGDNGACVKDHSISFVYVVRGQVVGSSADSTISTGDAQISCVRHFKIQMCHANTTRPRDSLVGSELTTIAPANQVFINTDSSVQGTGYTEDA